MRGKLKATACLLAAVLVLGAGGCKQKEDKNTQAVVDLTATVQWLLEEVPDPAFGSVGGEWLILGMARSTYDVPEGYFEGYYERLAAYVQEQDGILDERKMTEYSRTILALTAIGKNPADVEGYNLLEPLADYEKTIFQGTNGPAYALLALDAGNYEVPVLDGEGIQADREQYLRYLLEKEAEGGGWSLAGGAAEADVTAMVLQALAKYQDRADVAAAVERGLKVLSELQNEHGGYEAYGAENSETVSQVLLALTELGISPKDERFVKNGNTLTDNLLSFRTEEGAFRHTLDREADLMATEQAFYALVALERMENGKSSFYQIQSEGLVCTIEIRCDAALEADSGLSEGKAAVLPEDGKILGKTEVVFQEGDTVFDILCKVCETYEIQREYSWTPVYDSYYMEGINHLYEFDCGGQSGWMYQVNGQFPNVGCSSYSVESGDEIIWCYTVEGLGNDMGANVE